MLAGIDPGLDGGICILKDDMGLFAIFPMPTIEITTGKKKKREINIERVRSLLVDSFVNSVTMEKVHAMPARINGKPMQGITGTFNFGMGFGTLKGIIGALQIPFTLVHPRTWQAVMLRDMPKGKGSSILRAQQLCPGINLLVTERCKKPHDGMAEAYLIARYGLWSKKEGEEW